MDVVKATEGLTALTPEIDCNQMAMGSPPGLPPFTTAVIPHS
jgi:hypothetical protein